MPLSKCSAFERVEFGVDRASSYGGDVLKVLADLEVFGNHYMIYRHPELLMSATVENWLKDYSYTQDFKVPVPYEERHPCWLEMRELHNQIEEAIKWQTR